MTPPSLGRRLVALLGRPGSDDLGMRGFVAADPSGRLQVRGVADHLSTTLAPSDLADLIADGHALAVDGDVLIDGVEEALAADWIGEGLLAKIKALNAPLPPALPTDPGAHRHDAGRGWFVVRPTKDIYKALVRWTRSVLLATIQTRKPEIAKLALHGLPNSDDARAALWLTTPLEQRAVRLEWFARLDRDGGRSRRTPAEIERDLRELLRSLGVPGGAPEV